MRILRLKYQLNQGINDLKYALYNIINNNDYLSINNICLTIDKQRKVSKTEANKNKFERLFQSIKKSS